MRADSFGNSLSNDSELLEPGYHGLSNDRLNTPWPKLTRSLNALRASVETNPAITTLQALLRDDAQPADHELPRTGISMAQEQLLSSPFIRSADYGTRACTVLRVHRNGCVDFHEQTFGAHGIKGTDVRETFSVLRN